MQLESFIEVMEHIAPPALACDFDNPGLLIGPEHGDVANVLIALDCTSAVAWEAVEMRADLVLTHHPLFWKPVQKILPDDPETAAAYILMRHGIGLYAAHTNLDSASGGVNDALCERFALTDVIQYENGLGRIGTLATSRPLTLAGFVQVVNRVLDTKSRFVGDPDRIVTRVAVLGGAGGDTYAAAHALGADVLLTGEMKHHEGIGASQIGIAAVVAGHYETERIVLPSVIARLQSATNDVQYTLARSESAPFAQL